MDFRSFFFFLFILVGIIRTESQETENEREFSYLEDSILGPEHWGEINQAWTTCNNGYMQSPIDISNQNVELDSSLGMFQRSYKPTPAVLINRGHDIMMKWGGDGGGAGMVCIDETQYTLKQLHWHSPSEHSIDGRRFAMEIHMVHESIDGRFAVVAIMYKIGRPDSFLAELEESIHAIKSMDGEVEVGIIDPRHVKRGSLEYYRYIGSLTTPPCSEPVVWTIVRKIRTVSIHQVRLMRDAVNDNSESNARPIQPTNSRIIKLYCPHRICCFITQ